MARTYMRLDERPDPPKEKEKVEFKNKKQYYSHYPSLRHEANLRKISAVCALISVIGIATLTLSILCLTGTLHIELSFLDGTGLGNWLKSTSTAIFVSILVLSAVQIVFGIIAAVCTFKQMYYVNGLLSCVIMGIVSFWTIILLIISIILIIYYIRSRDSFFC